MYINLVTTILCNMAWGGNTRDNGRYFNKENSKLPQ